MSCEHTTGFVVRTLFSVFAGVDKHLLHNLIFLCFDLETMPCTCSILPFVNDKMWSQYCCADILTGW